MSKKNGVPVVTQLKPPAQPPKPPDPIENLRAAKSYVVILKLEDGSIRFACQGGIEELIGLHRLAALDIERQLLGIQQANNQPLIVPGTFIR